MTVESPFRFGYDSYAKHASKDKSPTSATTAPTQTTDGIGTEGLRRRTAAMNSSNMGMNTINTSSGNDSMDNDFMGLRPPTASLMMSSVGRMQNGINQTFHKSPSNMASQQTSTTKIPDVHENGNHPLTSNAIVTTAIDTPNVIQDEMDLEDIDFHQNVAKWVVVIAGFNPLLFKTIQQRFESYGTVIAIHTPTSSISETGNWMCLKYQSCLQAEKALCQDGTFHSMNATAGNQNGFSLNNSGQTSILIGVKRLNSEMVQQLGVDIHATGYGDHQKNHSVHSQSGIFDKFNKHENGTAFPQETSNKTQTTEKKICSLEEESILLGMEPSSSTSTSRMQQRQKDNSLCERVLSWIFMWD